MGLQFNFYDNCLEYRYRKISAQDINAAKSAFF